MSEGEGEGGGRPHSPEVYMAAHLPHNSKPMLLEWNLKKSSFENFI